MTRSAKLCLFSACSALFFTACSWEPASTSQEEPRELNQEFMPGEVLISVVQPHMCRIQLDNGTVAEVDNCSVYHSCDTGLRVWVLYQETRSIFGEEHNGWEPVLSVSVDPSSSQR